jgi:hypothetical protein
MVNNDTYIIMMEGAIKIYNEELECVEMFINNCDKI